MVNTERQNEIGARILQRRKELNISQGKLAEQTGIGRRALVYIEHGKRRIDVLELMALNQALQLSTDFLLTGHW